MNLFLSSCFQCWTLWLEGISKHFLVQNNILAHHWHGFLFSRMKRSQNQDISTYSWIYFQTTWQHTIFISLISTVCSAWLMHNCSLPCTTSQSLASTIYWHRELIQELVFFDGLLFHQTSLLCGQNSHASRGKKQVRLSILAYLYPFLLLVELQSETFNLS